MPDLHEIPGEQLELDDIAKLADRFKTVPGTVDDLSTITQD